jgi:hypothetical protein
VRCNQIIEAHLLKSLISLQTLFCILTLQHLQNTHIMLQWYDVCLTAYRNSHLIISLKTKTMKKISLLLIPALAMVFFISSCSKDDTTTTTNTTPTGTWTGTGQYGTTAGLPTYAFTLAFKANGTVDITGNNSTAIDIATGTWTIIADSVRAFYRYAGSSADYTLSGKYTAGSTLMVGTIGLGTSTTGVGLFSVTRQQ